MGPPLEEASAVVMLVHGRRQSRIDMLALAESLSRPDIAYFVPCAVLPNSWYPGKPLDPLPTNEPYLSFSLQVMKSNAEWLLAEGAKLDRLVLCGVAEGACLVAEWAVRSPRRYGGIAAVRGGLMGPPGTQWPRLGSCRGTRALLTASGRDGVVPPSRVRETAALLRRMGADVACEIHPEGDGSGWICESEISALSRLVASVASRPRK